MIDGKQAYKIPDPPDGLIDALERADEDTFPNIRKLLLISCVLPLGSCEAERAASGIIQAVKYSMFLYVQCILFEREC